MKKTMIILFSSILLLIPPAYAKNCKKGQPCGNSCISWSKTCHKNTYTYSSPIENQEKSKKPAPSSTNVLVRYVIPKKLNVRTSPTIKANINTSLSKGDFVLLHHQENQWAYISKSGVYGWVSKKYLSSSPVK
ncbi:SH3 domain-containing protein [Aeromonas veronii]|uniref:SH3 domain-containing protein n=1 Tax=Aeromonas veronii TaxID=654 RepID=UPI000DD0E9BB|nr:SH3 domain-containing protein [Aeromonas veronii]